MSLNMKRAIVTGGVTGIGRATVLAKLREGASVVSVSRTAPDSERAQQVIDGARKLRFGRVAHMQLDISKQAEVNRVFQAAVDSLGGLDDLVNSVAIEPVSCQRPVKLSGRADDRR